MMLRGCDVSSAQGQALDWQRITDSGLSFAICKATEHVGHVDSAFARNVAGVDAAGMTAGSYHFFRPEADPELQAEHYAKVVGDSTSMPPCIDFETLKGSDPADSHRRARAFVEAIEDLRAMRCILYTYPAFWFALLPTMNAEDLEFWAARPLWIANYGVKVPVVPRPWIWWTLWQFDGDGGRRLPNGVDADFNWFRGDADDMRAFISSCHLPRSRGPLPSFPDGPATPLGWETEAENDLAQEERTPTTNPQTPMSISERMRALRIGGDDDR